MLPGPSVYLTVMSSSNTPESGAVSRIGPSSRVLSTPSPVVVVSTVVPAVITPFCTVSPPAVANVIASDPLATYTFRGPRLEVVVVFSAIWSSPVADTS